MHRTLSITKSNNPEVDKNEKKKKKIKIKIKKGKKRNVKAIIRKDIMQKKARSGHPFIFLIDKRKLLLTRSLMNRLIYCKMS